MVFTKPFTPAQRAKALAVYRSLRANLKEVRTNFPPLNAEQRVIVREYRKVLRDFADVLRAENAKVDAARLNVLKDRADTVSLVYAMARNARPWRTGDD